MTSKNSQGGGGIKGYLSRAGASFYSCGMLCTGVSMWVAKRALWVSWIVVTTSMVTLMPLMLLISKEGQMLDLERLEAREMQNKGYTHQQLQQLGFSDVALYTPSVASSKK